MQMSMLGCAFVGGVRLRGVCVSVCVCVCGCV